MSVVVTIKGLGFTIPETGERDWGTEVTSWIQQISSAVSDLTVAGDVKLISVSVSNNQGSVANIENLNFDTATIRHAIVEYAVYRVTTTEELSQTGNLYLTYKSNANTWEIVDNAVGDAEITFTITNAGQVQYVTTNMGGSSYTGKMSFRGRVFPV